MTLSTHRGGQLRVPLTDGYWIYYLFGGPEYEPELASLLPRLLTGGEYFIDCGANIGYWSVFASRLVAPQQIFAVEPAGDTYRWLAANSELNGGFHTMQRAVWSRSDIPLSISANLERSASTSVSTHGDGPTVQSISVDDLAAGIPPSSPIVVKLDVEGSELAAFEGARRTLTRPSVFIYEDHGSDRASENTRGVMTDLQLDVFYLNPTGRVELVASIDSLGAVKVDRTRGYNFAAAVHGSWGAKRLTEISS